MINNPSVTVLMAAYNAEQHLRDAIQSVIKQDHEDWELILINDGSTDHTSLIASSYNDDRIRLICNEKNLGVAKSRNRGLKEANSEYIAVLDADDVALPHRLTIELEWMKSHPEVGLLCASAEVIDENNNIIGKLDPPNDNLTFLWNQLLHNSIVHSTVMYRTTAAIEAGGYDERFQPAEDYALWSKLAKIYKIGVLNEPMCQYRLSKTGLTRTANNQLELSACSIISQNIHNLIGKVPPKQVISSLRQPTEFLDLIYDSLKILELLICAFWKEYLINRERSSIHMLNMAILRDVSKVCVAKPTTWFQAYSMLLRLKKELCPSPFDVLALASFIGKQLILKYMRRVLS